MSGVKLNTTRREVQMAGYPEGHPSSKDVWITFNLDGPLELKTPLLGPDGKGHPAQFIMFQLTPDDASKLAHDLLNTIAEKTESVTEKCQRCGTRPATSAHTCPFQEEIYDSKVECNCCDECRSDCCMEI